jgi:hypothetical protein
VAGLAATLIKFLDFKEPQLGHRDVLSKNAEDVLLIRTCV